MWRALRYLESQCGGEAVRGPIQGAQDGLTGLFDRRPCEQTVLQGEESQQSHIHNQRLEDSAVP